VKDGLAHNAVHERLRDDADDGALLVHDADGARDVGAGVSFNIIYKAYLLCTKLVIGQLIFWFERS